MKSWKSFLNKKGTVILALFALLVWGVACQKNEGSSVGASPYGVGIYGNYGQGCTNCFANPSVLLAGVKSSTGYGEWLMRFDILANSATPVNLADPKSPLYYSGAAALQGVITVINQLSGCMNVAPGDYQVRTVQVGQMMMGTLSGMKLEAVGPGGRILMSVGTSTLYNPNGVSRYDLEGNRLGMNLRLDFVNGQPCGPLSTY